MLNRKRVVYLFTDITTLFYFIMNTHTLLNTEEILYSGKLVNHNPKSIIDSGYRKGFLVYKSGSESLLKDDNFNKFYVETETLRVTYPELESFRTHENNFCCLQELLKYGEHNDYTFHKFDNEKALNDFIKVAKNSKYKCKDTKWTEVYHFKHLPTISYNVDL